MYWRVRSLVKVPLEGWVMSKVPFPASIRALPDTICSVQIQWFESQDGSGIYLVAATYVSHAIYISVATYASFTIYLSIYLVLTDCLSISQAML